MRDLVVLKAEDGTPEQQLVFAEVYAPGRPDSGGDYMTVEDVQKAAYRFMKGNRLDLVDSQHDNQLVPGCSIVESFIARKGDPLFIEGSWVVGMHIDNAAMWQKIKNGEINGFSLEALAHAEPSTVEMEIPPVVSGLTSEVEGHTHQFYVTYDDQGQFLGGRTSVDNMHSHQIRGGSVTESAAGHAHRFSAVDDLLIS